MKTIKEAAKLYIKMYIKSNRIMSERVLTDSELERIKRGQSHWKQVVPRERFPHGGKVDNETLDHIIDNIVDDVWKNAKAFYSKIDTKLHFCNTCDTITLNPSAASVHYCSCCGKEIKLCQKEK